MGTSYTTEQKKQRVDQVLEQVICAFKMILFKAFRSAINFKESTQFHYFVSKLEIT